MGHFLTAQPAKQSSPLKDSVSERKNLHLAAQIGRHAGFLNLMHVFRAHLPKHLRKPLRPSTVVWNENKTNNTRMLTPLITLFPSISTSTTITTKKDKEYVFLSNRDDYSIKLDDTIYNKSLRIIS